MLFCLGRMPFQTSQNSKRSFYPPLFDSIFLGILTPGLHSNSRSFSNKFLRALGQVFGTFGAKELPIGCQVDVFWSTFGRQVEEWKPCSCLHGTITFEVWGSAETPQTEHVWDTGCQHAFGNVFFKGFWNLCRIWGSFGAPLAPLWDDFGMLFWRSVLEWFLNHFWEGPAQGFGPSESSNMQYWIPIQSRQVP